MRLMIIEPNTIAGEMLVKKAKLLGLELVAVTQENVWEKNYDEHLKHLIDEFVFVNFSKKEETKEKILNYSEHRKIDGIVTGFEFFSDLVVEIGQLMNLPTHLTKEPLILRDKWEMSKKFLECGVSSAKTVLFDEIHESNEINFPVIVKPTNNAGSFLVRKVENYSDLEKVVKEIKENDIEFPHGFKLDSRVIIQEVLEGPEYSVEIAVQNGKFFPVTVTDKITTHKNYFAELGHRVPSLIDKHGRDSLVELAIAGLKALGFYNGVAHAELIVTSSGPKIVEIGARPAGDYIPALIENALGIDLLKVYVDIALGNAVNIYQDKEAFSGISFLTSSTPKAIKEISYSEESSDDIHLYVKSGDSVRPSLDNMSRLGHIMVTKPSYREVDYYIVKHLDGLKIDY
ncbi:hypothetical protein CAC02_07075 [Streptococcus gallolyticus]|uniref:ATP-grasp domain-containing protein n=1 Tax=Streptococcus gallolyticus TaxID=315405 RepID=A0A368UDK4_9STRE|nr:ATP-grasp domain-containing protein [Streptococcus gallolyticus]RCW16690.1 hypothetical protein CAC02_07075 [Streptococcus gallolyticus]